MVKNMEHERFAVANDEAFMHDIHRGLATGSEFGKETLSIDDLLDLF